VDFSKELNKEQLKAVETFDTPLFISAGAGTGKTRVITYKIAYLLQKLKKDPCNILALAFSNKAADEMKKRVIRFSENKKPDLWISTFHSLCTVILRREHPEDFIIIDDSDKNSILKDIIKGMELDTNIYNASLVNSTISKLKNLRIPHDRKSTVDPEHHGLEKIFAIYEKYEELKIRQNYFDFDDLLIRAIQLFYKDRNVLDKYRERFRYILVDEFQDTNEFQYELVYLLGYDKKNITIVGDPDQSIYSWRGASINNFTKFRNDFKNPLIIKLEQNYRSVNNILKAATSVIRLNSSHDKKILWSARANGEKVKAFTCPDIAQESAFVIEQINELKNEGYRYRDVALFCRTNYYYQNLEFAMREANIPYRIIGGLKFFEKVEIKNLLAYLKFINNQNDAMSLLRIINFPPRGIGKQTVDTIVETAAQKKTGLYKLLLSDHLDDHKRRDQLDLFTDLIQELIEKKNKMDLLELVTHLIKRTEYLEYLKKFPEYEIRLNNVNEFLKDIRDFMKQNKTGATLEEYIFRISLMTQIDELHEKEDDVHVITIHNAKGLEFKAVFIIGLQEGMFPHYRILRSEDYQTQIEEERRLFYVGLTRAKERVYLTGPQLFSFFGNNRIVDTSRFISEINPEFIEHV